MLKQVIFFTILLFNGNFGLEHNNNRYNPGSSTDFLQHEGGGNSQKQSVNTQNGGKLNYDAQFPALSSPTTKAAPSAGTTALNNLNAGKRDYVAQFPQLPSSTAAKAQNSGTQTAVNPQNNGKRDYVAPQYPTPKPNQWSTQPSSSTVAKPQSTSTQTTRNPQSPNGKRDYVAPQYPTLKPVQGSKVKDLVNFYDGQGNSQNVTPKMPSYSAMMNRNTGSTATTRFTPSTQKPLSTQTTRQWSYSNILSGSKTPTTVYTTFKPSTKVPGSPTSGLILPSTILNKNPSNLVVSSGPATDVELQTISEELLRKDVNNAARYVTINYQEKTNSHSLEDKAPNKLLTVSSEAWNIPTVQKFIPLLDNYERDTLVNEYVTPLERNEENEFMDAIMSTSVIRHLMNFLKIKGFVTPDPKQQRDYLKQLWFSLYSRGRGKIGSSGFEHIFVSELKNGEVSGLHNWIYFAREEQSNRINYLGYLKYAELDDKGAVLKHHFNQQGADKPVDTMFIGTSPELEIALYSLCFITRADKDCKLKLANKDVEIVTHTFRYRSKNLIGSGYPQI